VDWLKQMTNEELVETFATIVLDMQGQGARGRSNVYEAKQAIVQRLNEMEKTIAAAKKELVETEGITDEDEMNEAITKAVDTIDAWEIIHKTWEDKTEE
jgi:hypothetical protein